MASRQRYVQWLKSRRCWRFRRRVSGHLRDLIGQTEWTEILPARNRTEAVGAAIPIHRRDEPGHPTRQARKLASGQRRRDRHTGDRLAGMVQRGAA